MIEGSIEAENEEEQRYKLMEFCVNTHRYIFNLNQNLRKNAKKFNHVSPRDYLDFIKHFINIF